MTDVLKLTRKLDEITIDTDLLCKTAMAVEEGILRGQNVVDPEAIMLPNNMLLKIATRLKEVNDGFYDYIKTLNKDGAK